MHDLWNSRKLANIFLNSNQESNRGWCNELETDLDVPVVHQRCQKLHWKQAYIVYIQIVDGEAECTSGTATHQVMKSYHLIATEAFNEMSKHLLVVTPKNNSNLFN